MRTSISATLKASRKRKHDQQRRQQQLLDPTTRPARPMPVKLDGPPVDPRNLSPRSVLKKTRMIP